MKCNIVYCVDLKRRNELRRAIELYMLSAIDSFELDDILCPIKTSDCLCKAIAGQMWYFYDDTVRHFLNERSVSAKDTAMICRWMCVLSSHIRGCELITDSQETNFLLRIVTRLVSRSGPRFSSNEWWPFQNEASWLLFNTSEVGQAISPLICFTPQGGPASEIGQAVPDDSC